MKIIKIIDLDAEEMKEKKEQLNTKRNFRFELEDLKKQSHHLTPMFLYDESEKEWLMLYNSSSNYSQEELEECLKIIKQLNSQRRSNKNGSNK